MIQQTSLLAFDSIQSSLGFRQLQVLEFFRKFPLKDFTNTEVSFYLQLPINRITPRVYELRKGGYLMESQIRYCVITGRKVIAWRIIDQKKNNMEVD